VEARNAQFAGVLKPDHVGDDRHLGADPQLLQAVRMTDWKRWHAPYDDPQSPLSE
jgi:hypothetical protein